MNEFKFIKKGLIDLNGKTGFFSPPSALLLKCCGCFNPSHFYSHRMLLAYAASERSPKLMPKRPTEP